MSFWSRSYPYRDNTSAVLGHNIHMLEQKAIYSFQCLLQQFLFNWFVKQYESAFSLIWNNCKDEKIKHQD